MRTDALTDFTDLLPTFVSLVPVFDGRAEASGRSWIDAAGVRGKVNCFARAFRDGRYKVWVSDQREIIRLHDLRVGPWEETNLLDSAVPGHRAALMKFRRVVDATPARSTPHARPTPGTGRPTPEKRPRSRSPTPPLKESTPERPVSSTRDL